MSQPQENAQPGAPDEEIPLPGHPSQAEGEDPDHPDTGRDPVLPGHPSQAEGEDDERADVGEGRGAS